MTATISPIKRKSEEDIFTRKLRIAVISDLLEERWASMDLVAEALVAELKERYHEVEVTQIRPEFIRWCTYPRILCNQRFARHLDIVVNRFLRYHKYLANLAREFDVFHIIDHSYAHLVHALPAQAVVVTCHDVGAFRSVIEPVQERRSMPFRTMARRVLSGLQKAARIICVSNATRDDLLRYRIASPDRLVVVHNGVDRHCTWRPEPAGDQRAVQLLGPLANDQAEILHVGSTVPRKRIDVLIRTLAAVRSKLPNIRLVRVGGPFTDDQQRLVDDLNVGASIRVLPYLDRLTLAAVYRRAALLLMPSETEGFGLPMVEAMACKTLVIASDVPALREVGGSAAAYCPVGDIAVWARTTIGLLNERRDLKVVWAARRAKILERAGEFSWRENGRKTVELYHEIAMGCEMNRAVRSVVEVE